MLTQAIELSFSTPYIDFHFNYSTDDFTGRIMATAADQISVQGSHWRVDRDLRVGGMADIGGWTQCRDDLSANKTDFGSCYWFVGFRRKDSISNARARR